MPCACSEMIMSSRAPAIRLAGLGTSSGSNVPVRSRGHGRPPGPRRSAPSWQWCRCGNSRGRCGRPARAADGRGAWSARPPAPAPAPSDQLAEHRALPGQPRAGLITGGIPGPLRHRAVTGQHRSVSAFPLFTDFIVDLPDSPGVLTLIGLPSVTALVNFLR